jgi:hypothetical protein
MKYLDYIFFIMGFACFVISFFGNSIALYLSLAFGLTMMIYSGMNINARYKAGKVKKE